MVKSELIQILANQYPSLIRKDIIKIVDIIFLEIAKALCENEFSAVEIRGVGRFSTKVRNQRVSRNPKNGSIVHVPTTKYIKYKMSKNLFKRLNKNFTENKISDTY